MDPQKKKKIAAKHCFLLSGFLLHRGMVNFYFSLLRTLSFRQQWKSNSTPQLPNWPHSPKFNKHSKGGTKHERNCVFFLFLSPLRLYRQPLLLHFCSRHSVLSSSNRVFNCPPNYPSPSPSPPPRPFFQYRVFLSQTALLLPPLSSSFLRNPEKTTRSPLGPPWARLTTAR